MGLSCLFRSEQVVSRTASSLSTERSTQSDPLPTTDRRYETNTQTGSVIGDLLPVPRNSARRRPSKLSAMPFSQGEPGWMEPLCEPVSELRRAELGAIVASQSPEATAQQQQPLQLANQIFGTRLAVTLLKLFLESQLVDFPIFAHFLQAHGVSSTDGPALFAMR